MSEWVPPGGLLPAFDVSPKRRRRRLGFAVGFLVGLTVGSVLTLLLVAWRIGVMLDRPLAPVWQPLTPVAGLW